METHIQLSARQRYVIFTLLFGLLVAVIPDIFGALAYPQLFVGFFQLVIALLKSVLWALQGKKIPKQLRIYWLLVLAYFAIGAIVWVVLNYFSAQTRISFGCGYLALAWGIAVYHFKHILFLKA